MAPITKLLIANRGEIALRVIRTCEELGIATVAVHSTADLNSLHVQLATESVCIGEPPSNRSYLNIPNIIAAALSHNATAIHPVYGFLSESARFAEICADHKLIFVGPSPASIRAMGDKSTAKKTMQRAGVPTIPGSEGLIESDDQALKVAEKVGGQVSRALSAATGAPVAINAGAGRGGLQTRAAAATEVKKKKLEAVQTQADKKIEDEFKKIEKLIRI